LFYLPCMALYVLACLFMFFEFDAHFSCSNVSVPIKELEIWARFAVFQYIM